MSLDTSSKRASALGIGLASLNVLPYPPSVITNTQKREDYAYCYAGIAAANYTSTERDKRASIIGFQLEALRVLPYPVGVISRSERQLLVGSYTGIAASGPFDPAARDKRSSVLGLDLLPLRVRPSAKGSVDSASRQHLSGLYVGIAASEFIYSDVSKRQSIVQFNLPFMFAKPPHFGGITKLDRQHIAHLYSGIAVQTAVDVIINGATATIVLQTYPSVTVSDVAVIVPGKSIQAITYPPIYIIDTIISGGATNSSIVFTTFAPDIETTGSVAVGNADGVASVSGLSVATSVGVGRADGSSTASAINGSLGKGVGNSDGVATVQGFSSASVGNADGVASANGVGNHISVSVGHADGVSSASAVGVATIPTPGPKPVPRLRQKFTVINWRDEVISAWGDEFIARDTVYEFSNTRRFKDSGSHGGFYRP